jgi:hypothetical protein
VLKRVLLALFLFQVSHTFPAAIANCCATSFLFTANLSGQTATTSSSATSYCLLLFHEKTPLLCREKILIIFQFEKLQNAFIHYSWIWCFAFLVYIQLWFFSLYIWLLFSGTKNILSNPKLIQRSMVEPTPPKFSLFTISWRRRKHNVLKEGAEVGVYFEEGREKKLSEGANFWGF